MIDLPFRERFESPPDIDPQEIVDYFTLEFGISAGDPNQLPFTTEDFTYIGISVVDGIETMCWTVKGKELCATVKPYEDGYILGMDSLPGAINDN